MFGMVVGCARIECSAYTVASTFITSTGMSNLSSCADVGHTVLTRACQAHPACHR